MKKKLADLVDEMHRQLIENEDYRAYLAGRAVEGSLFADEVMMARMIRDMAIKTGDIRLGSAKLHDIRKALRVVKRRYGHDARRGKLGNYVWNWNDVVTCLTELEEDFQDVHQWISDDGARRDFAGDITETRQAIERLLGWVGSKRVGES